MTHAFASGYRIGDPGAPEELPRPSDRLAHHLRGAAGGRHQRGHHRRARPAPRADRAAAERAGRPAEPLQNAALLRRLERLAGGAGGGGCQLRVMVLLVIYVHVHTLSLRVCTKET